MKHFSLFEIIFPALNKAVETELLTLSNLLLDSLGIIEKRYDLVGNIFQVKADKITFFKQVEFIIPRKCYELKYATLT